MRYQILLFAASIVIFALILGVVLDWYIDPQTSAQKKDLVQALGLITAGVAGTVGIFFTWGGQRLARESLEDTRKNTEEELRLTREGQITERFTRAIDQLGATSDGSKSVEVRLGAIYALERISKESTEDYWPIMEILTAYVRQHAHRRSLTDESEGNVAEVNGAEEAHERDSTEKQVARDVPPLALDIQTIMAVLRRRTRSYGNGEPEPIDLRETNLSGAFLKEVNLAGSTLWGTKLSKAFLRQATLTKAYFFEAILTKADLTGTELSEAVLWKANLSGANLSEADLTGANLSEADLTGADLTRAALSKADLFEANLSGAKLLQATGLTQGQIHRAFGDETTQLPLPLTHPFSWPERFTDQVDEN